MKQSYFIFFFIFQTLFLKAQVSFTTVIPQRQVVVGESFQVQYIIEGAEQTDHIKPPGFDHFRLVAGPNIYNGSIMTVHGPQKIQNIIYTLEALQPGRFMIQGATLRHSQKSLRSNDVFVDVISVKDASRLLNKENGKLNTDYFLRPGEDPYKKIKENLFLKVQVDKKKCYAGEPVLATYKLYSCLESKSDIIKNPGFYGFSVFDMINLSDKEVVTEKVNGKLFDVHTIRKVQLFPLRSGLYTIDPMEVKNKVEFSRSAVSKKTEQEIAEGMLGIEAAPEKVDAVYFESTISTEPFSINVKPLTEKNKPANFNGAIGNFAITASILKNELTKNEEGVLEIAIKGTGNFIQLTAPVVNWPAGIDSFEPGVNDNFDKSLFPLTGTRTFRYPFIATVKGTNRIPAVQFSFFDIDSNSYKAIETNSTEFVLTDPLKINPVTLKKKISISDMNKSSSQIAGGIVLGLILIVLIYWLTKRKEPAPDVGLRPIERPDVDEIFKNASLSIGSTGNDFYKNLYHDLWNYLSVNLNLEGSAINKTKLSTLLQAKEIPDKVIEKLLELLNSCEEEQFTSVILADDKLKLLASAKEVIHAIEKQLF